MSSKWLWIVGLTTAGGFGWAAVPTPRPGAVNYIEGQVSIDQNRLSSSAGGSAILDAGQVLSTGNGRAEILLTPGVFMRVGKNSAVRMDSPELTNTRVALLKGEAMVEADILHREDRVMIAQGSAVAQLDKKGIYDFDADNGMVRVLDGKAIVREGDQNVDLGKGREANVNAQLASAKFDRDSAENSDPLYAWSKLRSEYLADATLSTSQTYFVGAPWWDGPGWYWNPWWGMYSFLPGDGFFYSPFGYGLYSPVYVYSSPFGFRSRIGSVRAGALNGSMMRGHFSGSGVRGPVNSGPAMRGPMVGAGRFGGFGRAAGGRMGGGRR